MIISTAVTGHNSKLIKTRDQYLHELDVKQCLSIDLTAISTKEVEPNNSAYTIVRGGDRERSKQDRNTTWDVLLFPIQERSIVDVARLGIWSARLVQISCRSKDVLSDMTQRAGLEVSY